MNPKKPQRSGRNATVGTYKQRHSTSTVDKHEQWVQWCKANGVVPVSLVHGKWVRTNALGKDRRNRSASVKLKDDCILHYDHTTSITYPFTDGRPQTPAQRYKAQLNQQIHQRARDAERQVRKKKTAQRAHQQLAECVDMPVFGYLADKGLSSTHGIRWHHEQRCWCVPMTDVNGTVYSIQRIYSDKHNESRKLFLEDTRVSGLMYVMGELPRQLQVIVCEGFATAATVREETGRPVVCAFTANNLLPVCEAIRATYRDIEIIVAGDDDRHKESNTGRLKAEVAALAVGGKTLYPAFHAKCARCIDFNDVSACQLCRGDS